MNVNSWLMFFQYAACFGVELTMNNIAAGYFSDEFGLSTSKAGIVASLFGLMNIFARSLGGIWSGELRGGLRFGPVLSCPFLVSSVVLCPILFCPIPSY